MDGIAGDLLTDAVIVPATVVGGILVLGTWLVRERALLAATALGLGIIAAYAQIRGLDLDWPRAASDKLPLALACGVAGSFLAIRHRRPLVAALIALWGPILLIAARPLAAGDFAPPLLIGGVVFGVWHALERPGAARRRVWRVVVLALGLAGTALFARTLLFAELALATGAAAVVTLIRPSETASLLPAAAVLGAIATALGLYSAAPAGALLVLASVPFVHHPGRRVAVRLRLSEPLLFYTATLLPPLAAAVWTLWSEGRPLYF